MSGNRKNSEKEKSEGLGLGGALLLGAGAAVAGFLARGLLNSYEAQSTASGSGSPRPGGPRSSCNSTPPRNSPPNQSSDWEDNIDKKIGIRQKQRDACRESNVSDDMKCIVCFNNPREVCLIPCRHVVLCEDCVEKIEKIDNKCPQCQQEIKSKKIVYM